MKVGSYEILPLDPNTLNPFSTGCKYHPPPGKYIGKNKATYLNVWNNFRTLGLVRCEKMDETGNKTTE